MSDAMSACMCIEVDVSDLRVATINSFEICALCSLPSVRRISTICHKQGRESFNLRYASTCNANMRQTAGCNREGTCIGSNVREGESGYCLRIAQPALLLLQQLP